jgi:hypothetical protein
MHSPVSDPNTRGIVFDGSAKRNPPMVLGRPTSASRKCARTPLDALQSRLQLWAHGRPVLVRMTSDDMTDPEQTVGNPLFGLSGHATDSGRTDVLLRFICQR